MVHIVSVALFGNKACLFSCFLVYRDGCSSSIANIQIYLTAAILISSSYFCSAHKFLTQQARPPP